VRRNVPNGTVSLFHRGVLNECVRGGLIVAYGRKRNFLGSDPKQTDADERPIRQRRDAGMTIEVRQETAYR
jgi:hypothetical protein